MAAARILIISLALAAMPAFAQTFTADHTNSLKAAYGYFMPSAGNYKNPIETAFKSAFNSPKQFVGLRLEHPRGYGKRNICGEYGITYFINQRKNIGDTLKLNWFANNFYLILKYDLLPQNKYIDLFMCGGALVGSQRIIVNGRSTQVYRNFYACALPQIELRIQAIKQISLGFEASYLYDLTNPRWKSRSGGYLLNHSKFSGATANVFIGWCWR